VASSAFDHILDHSDRLFYYRHAARAYDIDNKFIGISGRPDIQRIFVFAHDRGVKVTSLEAILNWGMACLSLVCMAMILRELSKRLGQALHLKKYYLIFDAGIILLIGALAAMILEDVWSENVLILILSRLSFFVGTLLIVGTTARYWAWIIPEVVTSSKK
jgi:hypothetical protein